MSLKKKSTPKHNKPLVAIVMGSDSDLPIMKEAAEVLEHFQLAYSIQIVSAHRTPKYMVEFAETAHKKGIQCIIAGAGGAAHLPGMIASLSPLPVLGVPIQSKTLQGLDSLYSIVQMPKGIPVACLAINGAANAALLAVRILSLQDQKLHKLLETYIQNQTQQVFSKAAQLDKVGFKKYLLNK